MWYGVDFDKTLIGEDGQPIWDMVDKVNYALSEGRDVRIFTARLTGDNPTDSRRRIEEFCREYFGRDLPITNEKDYEMEEIWDDKSVNPLMEESNMMGIGNLAGAIKEKVKKFGKNKRVQKLAKLGTSKSGYKGAFGAMHDKRMSMED